MRKRSTLKLIHVGLVAAIMMLMIMLPSMLQNHGIFIIRGDYVDQYLPRLMRTKFVFDHGFGQWDWLCLFGFPHTNICTLDLLCFLFPVRWIPWVVTYVHLLRMALIAMCSYAYLRYMLKTDKYAFLAAVIYTFSSFSFISMEFMQHFEAFWTFPLLLLSVEKMFRAERYKHQLILTAFLGNMVDVYLFVFSTISFALYFVCRFFFAEEWRSKRTFKYFCMAVLEYVIGFLCGFFHVAIVIFNTLNSNGSVSNIGIASLTPVSFFLDKTIVSRIFSFLLPAASNRFGTFGSSSWATRSAYLPVFGIAFVIACLWKKDSPKWLKIMCVANALCMLITGISFIYNMFSETYTRYAYSIVLVFALATAYFLENYEHRMAKKSVCVTIALVLGMLGLYYLIHSLYGDNSVVKAYLHDRKTGPSMEAKLQLYTCMVAMCMYALLFLIVWNKKAHEKMLPIVIAAIVLYGMSYSQVNLTSHNLMDYFTDTSMQLKQQVEQYFVNLPNVDDKMDYRIDQGMQLRNYAYTVQKPSLSVFETVRSKYANETCRYLGYHNGSVPATGDNALRTLMGVKYYYDVFTPDGLPIPDGFTYLRTDKNVDVYQNNHFMGLGFTYDSYMLRSDFDRIAKEDASNAELMLNTLIVEDADEAFVADVLRPFDEVGATQNRVSLENFRISSHGFTAEVHTDRPQIVFVSLPYEDNGWTAKINGEKTEFIRANVGFVAFKTKAGNNEIRFQYLNPATIPGIIISCVGVIVLIVYLVGYHRKKKPAVR